MEKGAKVFLKKYIHCSLINYFGFKSFHTAIEYDGVEYFFGLKKPNNQINKNKHVNDLYDKEKSDNNENIKFNYYNAVENTKDNSSVFEILPSTYHFFNSSKEKTNEVSKENYDITSFLLGTVSRKTFYEILNEVKLKYNNTKYNSVLNNCNHFSIEFIKKLFPGKFNNSTNQIIRSLFNITLGALDKEISVNIKDHKKSILPFKIKSNAMTNPNSYNSKEEINKEKEKNNLFKTKSLKFNDFKLPSTLTKFLNINDDNKNDIANFNFNNNKIKLKTSITKNYLNKFNNNKNNNENTNINNQIQVDKSIEYYCMQNIDEEDTRELSKFDSRITLQTDYDDENECENTNNSLSTIDTEINNSKIMLSSIFSKK